jgi:adenylosuccinate lyase
MTGFDSYQSPFTWRYGSPEMRALWSEREKRRTWRQLWVAMAEAQSALGLVTTAQVQELKAHAEEIDVARALEIEKKIHHDLMAEIKVYAAQCPNAGGVLHLGATSMDIKDNAEVLQIKRSLEFLLPKLETVLKAFTEKIETYAALPVIAFTHLQPAEPTTLGYRLASYAQDMLADHEALTRVFTALKGKGFKGAVGNAAASVSLYGLDGQRQFEEQVSRTIDLAFYPVATQTSPRKQDYDTLSALAGLAGSASKFAFDLRLLQSEVIGELAEPFGEEQVGSSAMPYKRNPIECEKINSLARAVSTAPLTAWNNAANSLLERTLDDSANRRTLFPETFLAVDEILDSMARIVTDLKVNPAMIQRNLEKFGPFAAVEKVLVACVKQGADRQELHEELRRLSMAAWKEIQQGRDNPLTGLVSESKAVTHWVDESELQGLFDVKSYTGIAESRSREISKTIKARLEESEYSKISW